MSKESSVIPVPEVERKIHLIRGRRVMIDSDLAALYRVPTFRLNEAVKRNRKRFPDRYAFVLTQQEVASLRSQFAISKVGRGGRRYLPYAFTEHGVSMLSAVLSSERAIEMSIAIIDAFIRLREMIAAHKDLADRMEKAEATLGNHASVLTMIVNEIKTMKALPEPSKKRIGFQRDQD